MIFNINFFLFSFAQSMVFSYLCVIAKHYANISNSDYGLLAMVTPFVSLFAKPIACSLADAHSIHKRVLVGSLAAYGISYGGLAIVGFLKDPADHEHDTLAWLTMCVLITCGSVSMSCVFCMNDALASNYARKHNLSYGKMRIWSNLGWAAGALVIMVVGEVRWLPFRTLGCILLALAIVVDLAFLMLWPYDEDFEMFHDGSTVEQRKLSIAGPNTLALIKQNKPRGSISRDILERIRAGRSKSTGHIPRLGDSVATILSAKAAEPKKEKEYSNLQIQFILIGMIAKQHKSFMRYIGLFTIFGIVQSIFWSFQLDYIKVRVVQDDAEFEFISALCMVAQSIFGEILINLVVADMIRLFGANANMSLALVTLGMRCYFYGQLLPYLGPYSIIFAEALQGPSLGLYWILTVDIGSNYALMVTDLMPEMRKRGIVKDKHHEEELSGCLRATMIGAMSSSMEGLGLALGAVIGGIISTNLGYDAMWNLSAAASIGVGFLNIGWDVLTKLILRRGKSDQRTDGKSPPDNKLSFGQIPSVVVEEFDVKL